VNGSAKFSYVPKTKGSFKYTFIYSGDTAYLSGKSAAVAVKVTA
jgi:hypothetical protein